MTETGEIPITNVRTYGDDPEFVLKCGLAYKRAADEENVAVSIKHFPGDGCDEVDQHILTSVNNLSCEEWDETYGKIYKGLIDDGALDGNGWPYCPAGIPEAFQPGFSRQTGSGNFKPRASSGAASR